MVIVLIGPSGAGKGTQAIRLARDPRFVHISTGDLFRDHLERKTELGLLVKRYIDRGELVPPEIPESMIATRLRESDPKTHILLDGYPRTEVQASLLDEVLGDLGRSVGAAVYLEVSDREVLSNRIPGRLTCRRCQSPFHERHHPPAEAGVCDLCGGGLHRRSDDTPERTRLRLRIFHRETVRVVDHYQKTGRLIIVDGERRIDEVHAAVESVITALERDEAPRASASEVEKIQARREAPREIPEGATCYLSLDVVLLGAPGSGKGTQAEELRESLGISHVSTGDLFREHLKAETELGKIAKTYMDRGDLVPDDVTESMVRERLAMPDTREGFVLDGFPRTRAQAEALTDILTDLNRKLCGVLYVRVSDERIVQRLAGRWICRRCQAPYHVEFKPPVESGRCDACGGELYQRDDDQPEVVRARLRTYHRQTAPLIEYYRRAGLLAEIDGEGGVEEVTEQAVRTARAWKRF